MMATRAGRMLNQILDVEELTEQLKSVLSALVESAKDSGRATYAGVQIACALRADEVLKLAVLAKDKHAFFWRDTNGCTYAGTGETRFVGLTGPQRYEVASRILDEVRMSWLPDCETGPWWHCGFAFDTAERTHPWALWPDGSLLMPRFLFEADDTSCTLRCFLCVEPDMTVYSAEEILSALEEVLFHSKAERGGVAQMGDSVVDDSVVSTNPMTRETWRHAVEEAIGEIANHTYEKIVMARMAMATPASGSGLVEVLQTLLRQYPHSFVFAAKASDEWFLGASPERLVAVRQGKVSIDCLAGTERRGETAKQDEQLAVRLLQSGKNLHEHRVVVDWVQSHIADLVTHVEVPSQPSIKRLRNVQHLHTPLTAELCPSGNILELVERLHPTPAVAGSPREAALVSLRRLEQWDRGWYAGPIGWVDGLGNGEFAVALRSALITHQGSYLFAGAGIVRDSEPDEEWTETEWKLRPMRHALGENEE